MGWLIAGLVLFVFNMMLGVGKLVEKIPDVGNRLAFAFGQTFALTAIVGIVALFSPGNRNPVSLGKVLFWTQVVALFVVLGG
jgi:hypothetical protein